MDHRIIESDALKANLTGKVEIVIPEEHRWILSLSAGHQAIHQRAEEFFLEYHHPYSNRKLAVDLLVPVTANDFGYYRQYPAEVWDRTVSAFFRIFGSLLGENLPDAVARHLITILLDFFTSNLEEEGGKYDAVLMDILQGHLAGNTYAYLSALGFFRRVMQTIAGRQEGGRVSVFMRDLIAANISFWEESTHLEEWYAANRSKMSRDYSPVIRSLGRDFYVSYRRELEKAGTLRELFALSYSFSDIINEYRRRIEVFATVPEQLCYIFYLLHLKGAEYYQEYLLMELNKAIERVGDEMDEAACRQMMDELFKFFGDFKESHLDLILDSILVLGKEVMNTGNTALIHYLEDKVIAFGFVSPGKASQTEQWKLQVNPCHIKNVRVWLELIEYNPEIMRKLLSALIIHVKVGGIFIFDTDFFQKDITRLLNSHISPLYKQIKVLTRNFPVFFNEIGAEGRLRDVSTTIDEISHRNDKLIHFLRKQIHVEGNNLHITIAREVARFWYSLKPDRLRELVPDNVFRTIDVKGEWVAGVHAVMQQLCICNGITFGTLLDTPPARMEEYLKRIGTHRPNDVQRVCRIIELYQLLKEKYVFDTTDIYLIADRYSFIAKEDAARLKELLDSHNHEEALKMVYSFMIRLNGIIFDPRKSVGSENIFYKRHVVFGIPSIYGYYREDKFDALGLVFRLERIASLLIGRIISGINTEYFTLRTFKEICLVLDYLREGLRLDGICNQGFDSQLQMLHYSLNSGCFTIGQYVNIFQFLETSLKEITNTYFIRPYESLLRTILPDYLTPEQKADAHTLNRNILMRSEIFYRDLISSAFIIQTLDNLIGVILNNLRKQADLLSESEIQGIMSYNQDLTACQLYRENPDLDNQVFIGAKAYFLKKLALNGYPVPPGFVLTTEIFRRIHSILKIPALNSEIDRLIRNNITELERMTGLQFGNPDRLLLLSVRSGAAISMPGAMNTFLNVGLNDEITERWSRQPEFAWTSWDCYRRLLQTWGMSFGMDRNDFDHIILHYKQKYRVNQKSGFSPAMMKEIAFAYRRLLSEHGIPFEDDPFRQLKQAIVSVFSSWDTPRAKVYRKHMQIADEWGTAVIVQKMIFGNLYNQSGSGVVFTHDNQEAESVIDLNGDFSFASQGEDIVAGLVNTLPISEKQRKKYYPNCTVSLETAFPKIYEQLRRTAVRLVEKEGFLHQEIEFTFENRNAEDLYILQTRNMNTLKDNRTEVFDTSAGRMERIGSGIGIGGKVLNGRLVFDLNDINGLRSLHPEAQAVLVRPDTVPDDIGLIFECEGLLTGKGGATSHAAVTAAALGKICVVNCGDMLVYEERKKCVIGGKEFSLFDKVAIDGINGVIYAGNYPVRIETL